MKKKIIIEEESNKDKINRKITIKEYNIESKVQD